MQPCFSSRISCKQHDLIGIIPVTGTASALAGGTWLDSEPPGPGKTCKYQPNFKDAPADHTGLNPQGAEVMTYPQALNCLRRLVGMQ